VFLYPYNNPEFQSPCGVKVSGKENGGLVIIRSYLFQSPCGVKVSGKGMYVALLKECMWFQSPCGVKVSGKRWARIPGRLRAFVSIPLRGKG